MTFSNSPYSDKDIEDITRNVEAYGDYALKSSIKYYAKEAIQTMRETTDMDDEQIFDEFVAYGISEEEQEILSNLLKMKSPDETNDSGVMPLSDFQLRNET